MDKHSKQQKQLWQFSTKKWNEKQKQKISCHPFPKHSYMNDDSCKYNEKHEQQHKDEEQNSNNSGQNNTHFQKLNKREKYGEIVMKKGKNL